MRRFVLTNLLRTGYAAEQIGLVYKLRWQIERLFKEWTSYANLHAFDTGKSEVAEELIWAAITVATVKRYAFLATNARRAHPERDRRSGRLH